MPRNNKDHSRSKAPEICPVCGEKVPARSLACPECGADHRSGWKNGEETADALDLPSGSFDYENFLREEFDSGSGHDRLNPIWWITAVILLLATIAGYILSVI